VQKAAFKISYLAVSRWIQKVTTVTKTFVPFSFVTPPKTPPHKSLSQRPLRASRQEAIRAQSSKKSLAKLARENKNKKQSENKKLTAD
jgi:hypothetical protein